MNFAGPHGADRKDKQHERNEDMDERTGSGAATEPRAYRPQLKFYHPNAKGTGCAIQLELLPAQNRREGAIMMSLANQMTVGDMRGAVPRFPRFDWENRITVKLGFMDLARMLQVFRGECESIGDGKGLYHRTSEFSTRIVLRHMVEPLQGYSLEVYRTPSDGSEESRAHFVMNSAEATGLAESISGSMAVVSFGVPGRHDAVDAQTLGGADAA